jgi:opacity protein-like surface antigen
MTSEHREQPARGTQQVRSGILQGRRRDARIDLIALVLAAIAFPAAAQDSGWNVSFMPYIWIPSVEARVHYGPPPPGGGSANVGIESNPLEHLNLALMLNGEARNGRWLLATDLIYLNFSNVNSTVKSVDLNPGAGTINVATSSLNVGTDSSLDGWLWTLVGGYRAVESHGATLDLIGGARYLNLAVKTDWNLTATITGSGAGGASASFPAQGNVQKTADVLSAIVGAKGRVQLGTGQWFLTYYGDLGGDSSTFTWQAIAGVGYALKWGDLVLNYRYLHYNQDSDRLIEKVDFYGVAIGASFHF